MPLATVTGVASELEPDGSQILEIVTPDGARLEAAISAHSLPLFLRTMQKSLIERVGASGEESVALPEWEATDINLAHRGTTTELMVSTRQISTLVLLLSDELLSELSDKINAVILHRSGPETSH